MEHSPWRGSKVTREGAHSSLCYGEVDTQGVSGSSRLEDSRRISGKPQLYEGQLG